MRLSLNKIVFPLLAGSAALMAADPDPRDREAILAMAGEFDVTFNFSETEPIQPGYTAAKPYTEEAQEFVTVVEDTPKKIVLQHILQVSDKAVVKHWKQIWTWDDTAVTEFKADDKWTTRKGDDTDGRWTQFVTQIDDGPRYEAAGKWAHADGISTWESDTTWRPLPRRELKRKDEYDVLVAQNRHTITPWGWTHHQHNVKTKVTGPEAPKPIVFENGLNTYRRVTDMDFGLAKKYWENTKEFWARVNLKWDSLEQPGKSITLKSGEGSLTRALGKMAGRAEKGETVTDEEIAEAFDKGVVLEETGAEITKQ